MTKRRAFTKDDVKYLRDNNGKIGKMQMVADLHTNLESVNDLMMENGIVYKRVVPKVKQKRVSEMKLPKNLDYVKANWQKMTDSDMGDKIGLSAGSVGTIRRGLGLKRNHVSNYQKRNGVELQSEKIDFYIDGKQVTGTKVKKYENILICEFGSERYVVKKKGKVAIIPNGEQSLRYGRHY